MLVAGLIEGKIGESDLTAAPLALSHGDRSLDRDILSRLGVKDIDSAVGP